MTLVPGHRARPKPAAERLEIVAADWRPERAGPRTTLIKVRQAEVPSSLIADLAGATITNIAWRAKDDPALIAGAMPVQRAGMTR